MTFVAHTARKTAYAACHARHTWPRRAATDSDCCHQMVSLSRILHRVLRGWKVRTSKCVAHARAASVATTMAQRQNAAARAPRGSTMNRAAEPPSIQHVPQQAASFRCFAPPSPKRREGARYLVPLETQRLAASPNCSSQHELMRDLATERLHRAQTEFERLQSAARVRTQGH